MSEKRKRPGARDTMVREAVASYEPRSMAQVFWLACQSLFKDDQGAFLTRLLKDAELREDILDSILILERQNEPSRPYEEFADELRREGRLSSR